MPQVHQHEAQSTERVLTARGDLQDLFEGLGGAAAEVVARAAMRGKRKIFRGILMAD